LPTTGIWRAKRRSLKRSLAAAQKRAGRDATPVTPAALIPCLLVGVLRLPFPRALLAFGEAGVHLGVVGVFAEDLVHGLLQRLRGRDGVILVGLDEDEFAARPAQAEEKRHAAEMRVFDFASAHALG